MKSKVHTYLFLAGAALLIMLLSMIAIPYLRGLVNKSADQTEVSRQAQKDTYYTLTVLGVPSGRKPILLDGREILVPLNGPCKVEISEGDFSISEGYCDDAQPAKFSLPDPDTDKDGMTVYTLWAELQADGDESLCADNEYKKPGLCMLEGLAVVNKSGTGIMDTVEPEFLHAFVNTDANSRTPHEEMSVFDDRLQGSFWRYDENGFKRLQLRMYQKEG
jgi:hypothetical protein